MANHLVRDGSGDITRTVLLGALAAGPAHGYEIKAKLARWDMEWWAEVRSGSIYAALKRLEADSYVERTATEREGNRPVRTVYAITDAGTAELRRLLADAWRGVIRYSRPIDVALSFSHHLPADEIVEHLRSRRSSLIQLREIFEQEVTKPLGRRQRQMVPDLRAHERLLIDAETTFTQLLIERFTSGAYDR